ncbi:ParA family protein [Tautonia marina]|uniref:ParA family protein n=1 Tax=Tautonia marina TaxID=2653855 RepID=UPI0012605297|nr:ParA family protein [Tautonia marina]
MHVVSIYNNKGGVGKSTLTVGVAEFLSSNRKKRVLVIDLDSQASSSCSLLGHREVAHAVQSHRSITKLADRLLRTRRSLAQPNDYITERPASMVKGTPLARIDVLVPDKPGILDIEERMHRTKDAGLFRDYLKPSLSAYDFVLVDLPSHVDQRHTLVVNGLVMSDFVLIPIEPNQISLNGLPDTFELIDYACDLNQEPVPKIVGMVLNKTDKRTQQYRTKLPQILEASSQKAMPPVFNNFLPDTPKLATSTDETIDFRTLKARFDTYYDNVRRVARELEQRCDGHTPEPPPKISFGTKIRDLLDRFSLGKTSRAKADVVDFEDALT